MVISVRLKSDSEILDVLKNLNTPIDTIDKYEKMFTLLPKDRVVEVSGSNNTLSLADEEYIISDDFIKEII
jgi:hypothetical protein